MHLTRRQVLEWSSEEFTLDDPALGQGLQRMLSDEPEHRNRYGLDEALFAYMGRAAAIA